jgi:hypothetical protein
MADSVKQKCESCEKLSSITSMHSNSDANWFCKKCIEEINDMPVMGKTVLSSSEKSIKGFNSLSKIVDQLEKCFYESIGGPLKNNTAFIALKRLAGKELANVGDTIEWSFPDNKKTPKYFRGNTFEGEVGSVNLKEKEYGVYCEYGQDHIGFKECKIIKRN